MKNDFRINLSLKLVSFFIAFIIWITIMNIIKPIVNGFVSVPITIENEKVIYDQNKTFTVLDQKICRVNFKVNADQLKLVKQSDFRAYIDLNDITSEGVVPIHYKALNNVDSFISNIEMQPKTLRVALSDIVRNELPVKYTTKGTLENGHSIGAVIMSPNVVYVSGSDDELSNISHVSISIPVNDHDEAFSGSAKPRIIGKDGKEIITDGISLNVDQISYYVLVFVSKDVIVNAVTIGDVEKGYALQNVEVVPSTITINGPRSDLENISTLELPLIDINGRTESFDLTFKMADIIPTGLTSQTNNDIVVRVNITSNSNVLNKSLVNDEDVGPHIN